VTSVRRVIASFAIAAALVVPATAAAQGLPTSEREALIRAFADRGGRATDLYPLLGVADQVAASGLPSAPVTNKIREGLAKGIPVSRIEPVARQIASHLTAADRLLRDLGPNPADRMAAITLLAESFGVGVTDAEVRALHQQTRASGATLSPDATAAAAKALGFIKDAKLSATDGAAVVAEAARRGYRSQEMVDLGREIKRRERSYQEGRESLRSLREAIARGDRPEQLFPEARPDRVERPAENRPANTTERPTRPEPQRPERPQTPERPQPPERPGGER
jgi:hypothetical protein